MININHIENSEKDRVISSEFSKEQFLKKKNITKRIVHIGKCLLVEELGRRILVIGDLHLGLEESLNNSGVFVTRKLYEELIGELEKVFKKIEGNDEEDGYGKKGVDEVVLLGDVKHEFGGIMRQEWKEVSKLIDYLREKMRRGGRKKRKGKEGKEGKIIIVKGNHDKLIEPIARRKEVEVRDYYVQGEICFLHGDRKIKEAEVKEIKYWIMGHGHPAVKVSDGVKVEKYKCFLVGRFKGREIIIVPSFGEYSQGSDPRENDVAAFRRREHRTPRGTQTAFGLGMAWDFNLDKFEVEIVGENLEVLKFGKLGKMK